MLFSSSVLCSISFLTYKFEFWNLVSIIFYFKISILNYGSGTCWSLSENSTHFPSLSSSQEVNSARSFLNFVLKPKEKLRLPVSRLSVSVKLTTTCELSLTVNQFFVLLTYVTLNIFISFSFSKIYFVSFRPRHVTNIWFVPFIMLDLKINSYKVNL